MITPSKTPAAQADTKRLTRDQSRCPGCGHVVQRSAWSMERRQYLQVYDCPKCSKRVEIPAVEERE